MQEIEVGLLARSYRGTVVEAEHYGSVAVCNADGTVVATVGDGELPVVLRSAAKPLQALSVVTSGAAEQFSFTPRHLAICCASHEGSAEHVQVVREILAMIKLGESALQCGVHWPSDRTESDRLRCAGEQPTVVHNNCSGKHAGMLATALALGASPAGYVRVDHPVQVLVREHLAPFSGVDEAQLRTVTDGCGLPTYALPLHGIATAFARLANPQKLPSELNGAAAQVVEAMGSHPDMVQGKGGFNTELLRAGRGRVIAKGGAEGLFAVGLPDLGLGLAVKIADGSERAWPPAVMALLSQQTDFDHLALGEYVRPVTTNCHGVQVGHLEAVRELTGLIP